MGNAFGRLAIVATLAAAWCGVPAAPAEAGHGGKDCGIISQGSNDYRAYAKRMKCRKARRSSLRYLRTGQARSGFDCAPTAGNSFYCQDPPKAYWAVRL